ncbi:cadherin domain-containing protein [Thermocoleostomius sinensis]|nr:cadherin domain-containing protein [Thermocoleostomius sinensis]
MPATPGNEFRVNTTTENSQVTYGPFSSTDHRTTRAVAADAEGNFVVVWSSQGQDDPAEPVGWGVYAQRYNKDGVAQGGPILVNQGHVVTGDQISAAVAMDADGDFIVTWSSYAFYQPLDRDGFGVFAQRFSRTGATQGSTFLVNTTTTGNQEDSDIATLADGRFIVTWTSRTHNHSDVYTCLYSATGAALGPEILVNSTTTGDQRNSSVAVDAQGRFVVVWESEGQDGSRSGIYAQIFAANGDKLGGEFRVNTYTTNDQKHPSVAIDADGDFVITWSSDGQDGNGWGVYARRFKIDESAANKRIEKDVADVRVNHVVSGSQQYSAVAMDANGNYTITWTSAVSGSGNDVLYRRYDANGNVLDRDQGGEGVFSANAYTLRNQEFSSIAIDGNGNFIIGWTSEDQTTGNPATSDQGNGVFARRFTVPSTANRTPTDIRLSASQVREDAAVETVIGTLSTIDPDTSDTHTYTLVAGAVDNATFKIVRLSTGQYQLRVNGPLDYETKPTYTVRIKTDDGRGGTLTKDLTITTLNVNEAPTNLTLSNTVVAENAAIGTEIGTLTGTDPEGPSGLTYSLVDNLADNGAFRIVNNKLVVNAGLDFETKDTYNIRIAVTDAEGLRFKKDFTIQVTNVNEAPTNLTLSKTTVNQNVGSNFEVGSFTTTDPDRNDTHTYALVNTSTNPDNAAFRIENNKLILISPPPSGKNSYQIQVRTTDAGGASFTRTFTITVDRTAANAPTNLTLSNDRIAENTGNNKEIGVFSTTDADAGDTHTYTFAESTAYPDNSAFRIEGNKLVLINSANFEVQNRYRIKVRTTDRAGLFIEREFTIRITNVNETPTALSLDNTEVNEGIPNNFTVGTFETTDPDAGDTHTYTLIDSTNFADNAAFRIENNKLILINSPNFETKPEYIIKVRTTDAGGKFLDRTFTITVNDTISGRPTGISLSNDRIVENSGNNQEIGRFSTTDPDDTQHTYTFVGTSDFPDNAAFRIEGNKLILINSPDFETKPSYRIKVRSTDDDNLFWEQTFTIVVENVNEAPTALVLSNSTVAENAGENTEIGTFATTDPDRNDTHTYTFTSNSTYPDNAAFRIEGNKLILINSPDFETKSEYTIRVRTTDAGGKSLNRTFTITVQDTGETPTALNLSRTNVDENVGDNFTVATLSTVDPDRGDTHTYTFVNNSIYPDNAAFRIDGNRLIVLRSPNFEAQPSYRIKLRSTDSGGRFVEREFTITVNDRPDRPPSDLTLSNSRLDEDAGSNAEVGTLTTTDPDVGDRHTYLLVGNLPDNSAFRLEGNKLILRDAPDFETKSSYRIKLRTTDGDGLFFEKEFTITIDNTNETPIGLNLSNTRVNEDVANNHTVGTFTTTDPDRNDTHTYTLIGNLPDNSAFRIDGNRLVLINSPNFEVKPIYTIRVRTTDAGGKFFDRTFTITVDDRNDAPTNLSLSRTDVDENVGDNVTVGTLTTTDPDLDDTHTYSLINGFGDNSAFAVSGNRLIVRQSPNFEVKPSYRIKIRTTDAEGLFFDKEFTITVNDRLDRPPTDLRLSNTQVSEDVADNVAVGSLSTIDLDLGDRHTYTLVGNLPDNSAFRINGNQLILINSPNFEAKSSYRIKLRTTDGDGLFFEKEFTITVLDGNDAPTNLTLSNTQLNENVGVNAEVDSFSTIDPDADDRHSYSLIDSATFADNSAFIISGNKLILRANPDFETKPSYRIKVRTTDRGGLSFDKEFTITINNVNDAPSDLRLSNAQLNENVGDNSEVGTFSTIDQDAGDSHTYSLVSGFQDNSAFIISGNKLILRANPDFETKPSYRIKVRTTDRGGLSFDKEFTITINNVNEAPIVTTASDVLTYTEDSDAILVDAAILVRDPDSATLAGATITIGGYRAGDRLLFTNQGAINGSFDPTTGILRLTGTTTIEAYQTALRSIQYIHNGHNPGTGDRLIRVTVTDGEVTSRVATRTIRIVPINDAPIVTTSTGELTYPENAGTLMIDADLTVRDEDSLFLESATVTINGYVAGQDRLEFTSPDRNIGAIFNNATGTLLLTGRAPVTTYQAVLRSIAYSNSRNNPSQTIRTIQFSVSDGEASSSPASRTVRLLPANSVPVVNLTDHVLIYRENASPIALDAAMRVIDDSGNLTGATIVLEGYVANQDRLHFVNQNGIRGSFASGILTLTGTASIAQYQQALRSITYANSSENPDTKSRTIRVTVTDGTATSVVATRLLQVVSVNDAPIVIPSVQSVLVTESTRTITLDPGLNLRDADHTNLTGATLVINGYLPGEDRLLFQDQNGITGRFNSATGVLSLTGTASLRHYRTALRSIQYANLSTVPTPAFRIVELTVTDGITPSHTAAIPIRFDRRLTLPVLDLNGADNGLDFRSTFVVTGPAVSIVSSDARLTHPNGSVLTSAQVVITNPHNWQTEELLVEIQNTGITARYDRQRSTLNLNGIASLATYLGVLRSVRYYNSSPTPDRTTRTVVFSVSDGTVRSEPAETTVQLTPVNLLNQGTPNDDQLVTTPATDLINTQAGNDTLFSILDYLQQNDQISGGDGLDTFVLQDGAGTAWVQVDNPVNQLSGILTGNTTITQFEWFDFSRFTGSVTMLGSDRRSNHLTGGRGNDVLVGGSGNDVLIGNAGHDRLDGGAGDDTLMGGFGDDTYVVDSVRDVIVEDVNGGFETVMASVNWTLASPLDDLILTGTAMVGTGNDLNNALTGNAMNNQLLGNGGNDILLGLGGNDRLLGGDGNDVLQGGNGNDRLIGGKGDDRLIGGSGRDVLAGGKGKDRFVILQAKKSRDTIKDFNPADDTIQISRQGFGRDLNRGKIKSHQFVLGSRATDSRDRFIYDRSAGVLFFDPDGVGGASAIQVAKLSNRPNLGRTDIAIVL